VPVYNSTTLDHYIEFSISTPVYPAVNSIPASNIYTLMYLPPTGPSVKAVIPPNTKVFNPNQGLAKIHYTKNAASIGPLGGTGNVKVWIFSISGSLIRTMEYQNADDYAAFFNPAVNLDTDMGINYYYFTWDGKNGHGSVVRNGMYIMKIEITTAAGVKTTASRTIAVIK
jgi:hypothetical protein